MFTLWIAASLAQDVPTTARVLQADLTTGAIVLESASDTVDRALTVAIQGPNRGMVSLALGPMAGPLPTPATLTLEPTRFELEPGQSATVHVTGTLPAPGAWVGQLNVTLAGQVTSSPLTINRLAPVGLLLDVEPPSAVIFDPILAAFADPQPISLVADVTNPGPAHARAQGPFLTGLTDAEGMGAPGFLASTAGDFRDLSPGMTQLPATATWTPAAGTWTGQVKVLDGNGGVSVVKAYTLRAKHGPFLCILALILGTLGNYVVHRWTTSGRRRNVALTNIVRLARRIEAIDGEGVPFRTTLTEALDDARTHLDEDAGWDPTDELKAVGLEIAAVGRVVRLLAECATLIGLIDDAGRRRPLEDELALLRGRAASGRREELRTIEGGATIEVDLQKLRESAHTAAMESVVALAEKVAGALPTEAGSRAGQMTAARDSLAALRSTPLSGRPPVEALVERRNRLMEVGNRVAELVAAEHLEKVAAMEAAPSWLRDPARWNTVRAGLREHLAGGRVEAAARLWSDTVLGRAEVIAEGWAKEAANQATAEEVRALVAAVRAAPTANAGLADCARLADRLTTAFGEMGAGGPLPGIVAVPGGAAMRWAPAPLPEEARLIAERRYKDSLVLVVAAAASVVVGLGTLWWPIPDFGSFTHYAAALLWGFSVQEAGRLTLPALLKDRVAQQ